MARPEIWKNTPSREELLKILDYDRDTGKITWKKRDQTSSDDRRWNSIRGGKDAGFTRKDFYRKVMIGGESYAAHRLIWKMVYDEEPIHIDHINGDRNDNRISNLRSVNHGVNMRNKTLYANNKSGFPGVEFHHRDGVWVAKIGAGNVQIHLGNFPTKDEAIACRIGAEVVLSYHQNHGRPKQQES